MKELRLSRLEREIMEILWKRGEASIREIQEAFPAKKRPSYATAQTTVYRLEAKEALGRVRKLGNFHIFAPVISRDAAQRSFIEELLTLFGGESRPIVAHLISAGKLTLDDVEYAEKMLKKLRKEDKA
ncbi:BlaI/MecI/CopY family transcriptional regulator [Granulicella sp. L46]|uniref:BlaI/MecI/CopY family transcriptional regulator n=1 Tax=Granulicella sp. L46 TaxID=1641865 RepID=UPI00131D06CF|nr:BlaI/MecI/CopY family transcriptional regulator [Granulicella sp. L46]